MTVAMVRKRHVFHAAGFDPYGTDVHYRRFVREAARFATTWQVTATVSQLHDEAVNRPSAAAFENGHWTVTTAGPGWQVETVYEQLDWSDIVTAELDRPAGWRLVKSAQGFADFVFSGTAWRYFAANWRYGIFFLVPFLEVLLFTAIAAALATATARAVLALLPIDVAVSPTTGRRPGLVMVVAALLAGGVVGVLAFALLLRWPGRRWRVAQALADWIFAREYLLQRRPDVDARVEAFAGRLIACARRAGTDEIVIAGHSLGATIVVDALARALARDPDLGRHGAQLCLLTIGATIPKLTLHPKGGWLRAHVHRIAREPSLAWAEYQARDDIISFHKFDPVNLKRRGIDVNAPGELVIRRVQIHQMLSPETLRRFRFNYMRLHYQFVMANERRTTYDYFMLLCGPAPFRRVITAPDGPAGLYEADGALRVSAEDATRTAAQ
jgi:hypothetical protein